jgi:integrase
LTWDDIDIVNKQIDIHSDKTKTRARRTVDIPENAASWLELCQITGKTELAPPRRALDVLKRAGGYQGRVFRSKSKSQEDTARVEQTTELPDWPEDALRHTAITYHYELHEHEGKTAKLAGNSPDVIYRHYKGRIGGDRKAAVAAFWGLRNPTFKYAWIASDEAEVPEES